MSKDRGIDVGKVAEYLQGLGADKDSQPINTKALRELLNAKTRPARKNSLSNNGDGRITIVIDGREVQAFPPDDPMENQGFGRR